MTVHPAISWMVNNTWTTGVLPVKWIELTCIALNTVSTHRNEPGVRRHARAALAAGATRDEILDALKGENVSSSRYDRPTPAGGRTWSLATRHEPAWWSRGKSGHGRRGDGEHRGRSHRGRP